MMNHVFDIVSFMGGAFVRILPYILISIPFSVFVNLSGKSVKVGEWFRKKPQLAIIAAVLFGSLSPLCSCTVIPVIYSLLLSGVPLGPVMAFWIASPSMDPEIFFLSLATVGTPLSIARVVVTFLLSYGGGLLTHILDSRGFFGTNYLRKNPNFSGFSIRHLVRNIAAVCSPKKNGKTVQQSSCCSSTGNATGKPVPANAGANCCGASAPKVEQPLLHRIVTESIRMSVFIMKFILLALFLEALIFLYLPDTFIPNMLAGRGWLAVPMAAVFGVPFYTSSLAALGIVSGLMTKGLSGAAALAFLIAGPTTTLPAMTAVFGITTRRVFLVYLALALGGALVFGWLYSIMEMFNSFLNG